MRFLIVMLASLLWLGGCASVPGLPNDELKRQVGAAERGFAATMKARDHAGFVSYLADDTLFFWGTKPLHGKQAVGDAWKKFYDSPEAPFSWEPDQIEVLSSGRLAASSGPVYAPDGKLVSRFNSVWRLEADGKWKIVYDKGEPVCDCKKGGQ